jgi:Rhodopirellula transposase DDE domain
LLQALDRLIDPDTGGDPESPLRWTCKSTRALAETLTAKGHPVSDDTVGRLLKQQGYRLQRTVNTLRAPNIPTGTPSSAISTSRLGRIWPPGSR